MAVADPYLTPAWTNQLYANLPGEAGTGVQSGGITSGGVPLLQGYNAWTYDALVQDNGTSAALTSGTIYGAKIYLTQRFQVSNVNMYCVAAGTATVALAGLYNSAGVLLASSGNMLSGTPVFASTSLSPGALATSATPAGSGVVQAGPGIVYAAIAIVTGTTTTLAGFTAAMTPFGNLGTSAPGSGASFANTSYRFAILGTGVTTALPSTVTPSSATASTIGFWAGLS
jgi:hypothetical protein